MSGHFSEPNIVGHMMTSTTTHKGKPVYTIDQIQSDWGQKLRDGGVRDEAKIAELTKRSDGMRDEIGKARERVRLAESKGFASDEARAARDELDRIVASDSLIRAELNTARGSASGNPLVNTTDQWVNTTLRRALRQAAESGADHVAVPSGQTVLSYNPGDTHGMETFYNQIVPKNLGNILSKFDKSIKPQAVDALETPGKGMAGQGFTLFSLPPEVRKRIINEGLPLFSIPAMLAAGLMGNSDQGSAAP